MRLDAEKAGVALLEVNDGGQSMKLNCLEGIDVLQLRRTLIEMAHKLSFGKEDISRSNLELGEEIDKLSSRSNLEVSKEIDKLELSKEIDKLNLSISLLNSRLLLIEKNGKKNLTLRECEELATQKCEMKDFLSPNPKTSFFRDWFNTFSELSQKSSSNRHRPRHSIDADIHADIVTTDGANVIPCPCFTSHLSGEAQAFSQVILLSLSPR